MPRFIIKSFVKKAMKIIALDEANRSSKKLFLKKHDKEAIIITNSKFYFIKTWLLFFPANFTQIISC